MEENRCEICGAFMAFYDEEPIGPHYSDGYYFECHNVNHYKHNILISSKDE